jgi:hypothetical protein
VPTEVLATHGAVSAETAAAMASGSARAARDGSRRLRHRRGGPAVARPRSRSASSTSTLWGPAESLPPISASRRSRDGACTGRRRGAATWSGGFCHKS